MKTISMDIRISVENIIIHTYIGFRKTVVVVVSTLGSMTPTVMGS